jgi:hypothetical protein
VRADAVRGDRRATYAVTGREQSRITGLVAAHVAARVVDGGLPPGVHHIDELPAFAHLPEELAAHGITLMAPVGH